MEIVNHSSHYELHIHAFKEYIKAFLSFSFVMVSNNLDFFLNEKASIYLSVLFSSSMSNILYVKVGLSSFPFSRSYISNASMQNINEAETYDKSRFFFGAQYSTYATKKKLKGKRIKIIPYSKIRKLLVFSL